jgi:hypothetical protein
MQFLVPAPSIHAQACRGVFNARYFGASGKKTDIATAAFPKAIDACATPGGGEIYFPAGDYTSETLHLRSHITALLMTDQLMIADLRSEQSHAYSAEKVLWQGCRDLPFEGDHQIVFTNAYKADIKNGTRESLTETLHACGQRAMGTIGLTASILSDNQGMKLPCMLDYTPDMPGQGVAGEVDDWR